MSSQILWNDSQLTEELAVLWIDQDQHRWNEKRIMEVISPSDVEEVFQVPLPLNPRADKLIWSLTKDRGISVKSFYHRLRERGHEAINTSQPRVSWSAIWNATVCPKVHLLCGS